MSGSRTITGIILSNTQLSGTAPAGTEIGKIQVTMSDGSAFDGNLTLSGAYASYFTITATRDPYAISALNLDNFTLPPGPAAGAKVGTLTVTMSDASVFGGALSVDDVAHFATSGMDLLTATALTSGQTYPVTVTASDAASTNQSLAGHFQIAVQAAAQVPGPLASITSPYQDTSSIQVAWTPPTTGGACDAGMHQIQWKTPTGNWNNAPSVPYCTSGHGSITDSYGNVWSVDASNHPVVNNVTDTYSNLTILYLVGGTIWQLDVGGAWWGSTPAGRISGMPSWFSGGGASPLTLTITGLSAGATYNLRGFATNAAGQGQYTATVNASTSAVQPSGGVGPAANSAFVTVDFASAFNYPNGTGQQNVSPYCYGSHSSSWMDFIGQSGDWFGNDAVMRQYGQINPGIQLFKCPGSMFNSDRSVNTSACANWANNIYKWFPTGIGGCVLLPPGIAAGNWPGVAPLNTTQYAQLLYDVANYFFNHTMANGQKFPLVGMGGEDECGASEDTLVGYYNAWIPRVKSISSNLLAFGPTMATPDYKDFGSRVAGLDVFCGNGFVNVTGGDPNNMTALNSWVANEASWGTQVTGANLKYAGFSSGGSDWDCGGAQLFSYPEAMLHCKQMINNLNCARVGSMTCFWGGLADCGLMDYPTSGGPHTGSGQIYPIGYWFAQGVRKVIGPRWRVPTNSTNMWAVAATPTNSRFGLLVFNVGNGSKSGQVALSHMPTGGSINAQGTGTAKVWQMTSAQNGPGKDGTSTLVNVTAGVTASLNFPDPSITIISS